MTTKTMQKTKFNYKKFLEDVYQKTYFLNGMILDELNMVDYPSENPLTYQDDQKPIISFHSYSDYGCFDSIQIIVMNKFSGSFVINDKEVEKRGILELEKIFGNLDNYNAANHMFSFYGEDVKYVDMFFWIFTDEELENNFDFIVKKTMPSFVVVSNLTECENFTMLFQSSSLKEAVAAMDKKIRYTCDEKHETSKNIVNINHMDKGKTLKELVDEFINRLDNPSRYGEYVHQTPYVFYGHWFNLDVVEVSNGFFIERIVKLKKNKTF